MKHVPAIFLFCLIATAQACAISERDNTRRVAPSEGVRESRDTEGESSFYISPLVNEDGWEIPGIKNSEVIRPRGLAGWASEKADVKVFVTTLEPEGTVIIDTASYFGEGYKGPASKLKRLSVLDVNRFDVGGRAYCYVITVRPEGLGMLHALVYLDADGDGKFEIVQESDLGEFAFAPAVPQWAK